MEEILGVLLLYHGPLGLPEEGRGKASASMALMPVAAL
jgi:hypothetical protein